MHHLMCQVDQSDFGVFLYGAGADPGIFLRGGAPLRLRNDVTGR